MKKTLFIMICLALGVALCLLDSVNFTLFSALTFSVCISLFIGIPSVAMCAIFGMVIDTLNYSLPFYTFIFLYISSGCVWVRGFFFKIRFFSAFLFWITALGFACIITGKNFIDTFLVNVLFFPIFYVFLKGFKFEKNYKV